VHERDMTPTLEQFHGAEIHLQVLRSYTRGGHYFREVVLRLEGSEIPVEFGANRISLFLFPAVARRLILEEHWPLGHILRECAVPHLNHPKAFLRVEPDALIRHALNLAGEQVLFGRRNVMVDPQGRPLSQIVEILPPVRRAP
jgi:chorismate-pyruvate lyase